MLRHFSGTIYRLYIRSHVNNYHELSLPHFQSYAFVVRLAALKCSLRERRDRETYIGGGYCAKIWV